MSTDNEKPRCWTAGSKVLPIVKLELEDQFVMTAQGKKPRPNWSAGSKALPTVKLDLNSLPPTLRLELRLVSGVAMPTEKLQEILDLLSKHYVSLGGDGLRCDSRSTNDLSPDGILRLVLSPVEAGDDEIQRQRLHQVEAAGNEVLRVNNRDKIRGHLSMLAAFRSEGIV